jgi:hypothetical protein
VPKRGLRWHKIINLRVQINNRLVSDVLAQVTMLDRFGASGLIYRGLTRLIVDFACPDSASGASAES